jgi:hypothetical protein
MTKINKAPGGQIVKLDIEKLTAIQKAIGAKMVAQVGILGVKSNRLETGKVSKEGGHKKTKEASDMTNADIGLAHEKGVKSQNIPRRSFIEVPLRTKDLDLNKVKASLWQAFTTGKSTIKEAYTKLGIAAENIIQGAFKTGGYGQWAPLDEKTIKRKKSASILIDTAQLRKSITSRVASK